MPSKWVVITLAGIFIAASITIGILVFLMIKTQKEEDEADRVYLKQKEELLKKAVQNNLSYGNETLGSQSGKLIENANNTKNNVNKSTSMLASLILKQKSYLQKLQDKYNQEKNKIFKN